MTVLGVIKSAKYGNIHRRHAIVETLVGPDADVVVAAGGTADLVFDVASETGRDIAYAGVESITGLPAGIVIAGITFNKTAKTLTVTVQNTTGADVTITANSVSVSVVSLS